MLDVSQALHGGYVGQIGDTVQDCVNAGQSANCITGAS